MNRDQRHLGDLFTRHGWRRTDGADYVLREWTARLHPCRSVRLIRWRNPERTIGDAVYIRDYAGRGWAEYVRNLASAIVRCDLPPAWTGILLHALGDSGGRFTRHGWRNWYDAGGDAIETCASMAAAGLMVRRHGTFYAATWEGAQAVGCALPPGERADAPLRHPEPPRG